MQPVTPYHQILFANDSWLRKQKRKEISQFLRSEVTHAVIVGPPGSLKTSCVKAVAENQGYLVNEFDIDGVWPEDRSSKELRSMLSHDVITLKKNIVRIVYNVNIVQTPATWVTGVKIPKGQKIVFEVYEIPKQFLQYDRDTLWRIRFPELTKRDMERFVKSIGYKGNIPAELMTCGDANMLYTSKSFPYQWKDKSFVHSWPAGQ